MDENRKTGLEPNSAQIPPIAEAAKFRRRALLQSFMRAALFTLRRAQDFATRRRSSRGRGQTGAQIDTRSAIMREAKRSRGKQKGTGKHRPPRAPQRSTTKKHGPGPTTPKV